MTAINYRLWRESGSGLGEGREEEEEGARLGEEGLKERWEGKQHPKVSRDEREAVARETRSISHQARGVHPPLGEVWPVWLHPSLEQGARVLFEDTQESLDVRAGKAHRDLLIHATELQLDACHC